MPVWKESLDSDCGLSIVVRHGDVLEELRQLETESVHCCVTSPPYWGLRDYGVPGQIGVESAPEEYVAKMVGIFREVRRVLRNDGTLWLNLGDSYFGSWGNYGGQNRGKGEGQREIIKGSKAHQKSYDGLEKWRPPAARDKMGYLKAKDLVGIPWRVAFALQHDGWYLRQDIIWAKPNPMPESVTDRCTKAHEYLFLLTKSARYYFDHRAIQEPSVESSCGNKKRVTAKERGCPAEGTGSGIPWSGLTRNKRDVWTIATRPYKEAHFATFPPKLVEPCVLAGSPKGGVVLDPFAGSGTALVVARGLGRNAVGIELRAEYLELIWKRVIG